LKSPKFNGPKPILLFDGACNLCDGLVQFVIRRDPEAKFLFASLQSKAGQEFVAKFKLPHDDFDSFVMIDGERFYTKSTATLNVLRRLGGMWQLLYVFIVIPKPLRDFVYNLVARNRYKWFGKKDQCMLPEPGVQKRFLTVDYKISKKEEVNSVDIL
jgi:predicted DCC family thiol-disulfide oxidoreductase YuxK